MTTNRSSAAPESTATHATVPLAKGPTKSIPALEDELLSKHPDIYTQEELQLNTNRLDAVLQQAHALVCEDRRWPKSAVAQRLTVTNARELFSDGRANNGRPMTDRDSVTEIGPDHYLISLYVPVFNETTRLHEYPHGQSPVQQPSVLACC